MKNEIGLCPVALSAVLCGLLILWLLDIREHQHDKYADELDIKDCFSKAFTSLYDFVFCLGIWALCFQVFFISLFGVSVIAKLTVNIPIVYEILK